MTLPREYPTHIVTEERIIWHRPITFIFHVRDKETKEPLEGVLVLGRNIIRPIIRFTDKEGKCDFKIRSTLSVTCSFRKQGYKTVPRKRYMYNPQVAVVYPEKAYIAEFYIDMEKE